MRSSSLLQEYIKRILSEKKSDDLKIKFPNLSSEIDELEKSVHPKYLVWCVKQLTQDFSINDLIPTIKFYDKNSSKFQSKDINTYKTLKDLENELKEIGSKSKTELRKEVKSEGSEKLFEDDQFLLLYIKNKDASVTYGAGTKWCITMRDAKYFEQYSNDNVVFYFLINKNLDQKNSLSKLAFAIYRDKKNKVIETDIFNAKDKQITIPKGLEKFLKISEQDAPKRPMGLISKLKFNLASEEEVLSLINDKDSDVRYQVARRTGVEHLPKMMNDEESGVRWQVAERIGSAGGARARECLPKMMNDKDFGVRSQVATRIGSVGGAFAREYLPMMMNDKHFEVRCDVVKRIVAVGGAFAREHLPKMMNDKSSEVRQEVAKRIDPNHLPKMMNDKNHWVREEVAKRIGIEHLPKMMNDKDSDIRLEIVRRIGSKGGAFAREHLPKMMNDKYSQVRHEVAERMKKLK